MLGFSLGFHVVFDVVLGREQKNSDSRALHPSSPDEEHVCQERGDSG